jgi:5-methylcytosine-specific restriction endonuclease McrA
MSKIYLAQDKWSPTIDHVIPVSQGGTDDLANLKLAHMICNAKKGKFGGNEQLLLVG